MQFVYIFVLHFFFTKNIFVSTLSSNPTLFISTLFITALEFVYLKRYILFRFSCLKVYMHKNVSDYCDLRNMSVKRNKETVY
jgi:hypothetical protein